MGYEVRVDKDICLSAGKCVAEAPTAFRFDEDEISEPTAGVHMLTDGRIREIARDCPAGAIQVFDRGVEITLD